MHTYKVTGTYTLPDESLDDNQPFPLMLDSFFATFYPMEHIIRKHIDCFKTVAGELYFWSPRREEDIYSIADNDAYSDDQKLELIHEAGHALVFRGDSSLDAYSRLEVLYGPTFPQLKTKPLMFPTLMGFLSCDESMAFNLMCTDSVGEYGMYLRQSPRNPQKYDPILADKIARDLVAQLDVECEE